MVNGSLEFDLVKCVGFYEMMKVTGVETWLP